jgi:DNA phosphorothioation-dependent restriction protein DptG
MTRAQKVSELRRRCIRANEGVLWDDHGNVLKRVIRQPGEVQGYTVLTKIMLIDVLKTWEWVYQKTADRRDDDEDAAEVHKEIAQQIETLWDCAADDLTQQSDKVIDLLAEHVLVDIPRAKRKGK